MAFGTPRSQTVTAGGKGSFKAPPDGYTKMPTGLPSGGGDKGSAPSKVTYTGIHVPGIGGSRKTATNNRKSLKASLPSATNHGSK